MSLRRQCALLDINRSTVYYRRRSGTDDAVMNRILQTCPFYDYRKKIRPAFCSGYFFLT